MSAGSFAGHRHLPAELLKGVEGVRLRLMAIVGPGLPPRMEHRAAVLPQQNVRLGMGNPANARKLCVGSSVAAGGWRTLRCAKFPRFSRVGGSRLRKPASREEWRGRSQLRLATPMSELLDRFSQH
jgi:hypothetical protein